MRTLTRQTNSILVSSDFQDITVSEINLKLSVMINEKEKQAFGH